MDWDIDVAGTSKVLTDTQTAAEPFNKLSKDYGDKLNNLITPLKYDAFAVVAVAIGEYATHWQPTIEAAAKQVGSSLTGASNAVRAYMNGQHDMVLNAQQAAGRGEIPKPPGSTRPTGGNRAE
ncbi:hypothetical protein E0H73_17290 [Kribbella pittospori]|uniref:Uncharacterized protein n=1 Tax=Kribbella pittospori TaxID=722689 RepID=A0A4R0KK16_9ACTN|nr:DUF6507 family protein [Kribbella pittospori]TCC61011.1 hypothetical protein E0H73_17290 [Kribbella pittospori]